MENVFTKKLIRSKSGLKIVASNDNFRSPFTLCEPPWIPDHETTHCTKCKAKFDFITRRHHCRRCGQIYCNACCDTKVGLPRMCFVDPVRVCSVCAEITSRESDFFNRQLKTLITGATFIVDVASSENIDLSSFLSCKLSQDHRQLLFEGPLADDLGQVELSQIRHLDVSKDETEGAGRVEIVYTGDEDKERRLKLCSGPEPHRKLANSWINAINQAFKMIASDVPSFRGKTNL